ncbi:MAG: hypothetical protein R3C18_09760 [Planctomycetaceae bacterium]
MNRNEDLSNQHHERNPTQPPSLTQSARWPCVLKRLEDVDIPGANPADIERVLIELAAWHQGCGDPVTVSEEWDEVEGK